jgi:hypothetical protein
LTGTTILFGALQPNAPEPEQIKFSEQDHATAWVVWSIIATDLEAQIGPQQSCFKPSTADALATENAIRRVLVNGGETDLQLANIEMQMALPPEDETIAFVCSIIVSAISILTQTFL